MDFLNGRLQAFLGPPGAAGAPDDLESVIIDFIDQSEHTLDIAVQEIDNPRIVNEILKAKTSAYFMMFTFAKSTTIDDALITKMKGGSFEVVGVLDGTQSAHKCSPHKTLMNNDAKLRRETLPDSGKLHHKLIVLDDHTVIGESFNYTGPANRYNDENLFLVRDPDVAALFKDEVKRVYQSTALSADF